MNFESLELHTTSSRKYCKPQGQRACSFTKEVTQNLAPCLAQAIDLVLFALAQGPGKGKSLMHYTSLPGKREKDVGNGKSYGILQLENQGKSRLSYLLRAASLWQMQRCSLNHPNPTRAFTWHNLPSCSQASLPTISLLFQVSTCLCFEEVTIISS